VSNQDSHTGSFDHSGGEGKSTRGAKWPQLLPVQGETENVAGESEAGEVVKPATAWEQSTSESKGKQNLPCGGGKRRRRDGRTVR